MKETYIFDYVNENEFRKFQNVCIELRRMLVATVTTAKAKL